MGSASNLTLDQLLESIHMSNQLKVDFTDAERVAFQQRAEHLGGSNPEAAQRAWRELIAQVRAAIDAGTPSSDPGVIELGRPRPFPSQ